MEDDFGQEIIPCRICGTPTPMIGTRLCDRCWELEHRIESDPELATKILKGLDDTSEFKLTQENTIREILNDIEDFRIKLEKGEISEGSPDWVVRICQAKILGKAGYKDRASFAADYARLNGLCDSKSKEIVFPDVIRHTGKSEDMEDKP